MVSGDNTDEVKKSKAKARGKACIGRVRNQTTKLKGIIRTFTRPSYALRTGIGRLKPESQSLRSEHRNKLRYLLRQLVRKQNWDETSGVLCVLLKGTLRDNSILRNRPKYWAMLELLKHIKGGGINQRKIQRAYEIWMKKNGSMKTLPMKDRFIVQSEFIVFCLAHGNIDDAHEAVIGLMQETGLESDPVSSLVVGLTFYQLWYSAIPEESQLRDLNESYTSVQSEMPETSLIMSIEDSKGYNSNEVQEVNDPLQCDSNPSVRNDENIDLDVDFDQHQEVSMEVDRNRCGETAHQNLQTQGFYMNSAESSGHEGSDTPYASIFSVHGLEPWLLPLRLPHSNESLENFIRLHGTLRTSYYKNAVKYLRVALYSTPPLFEALIPLIQILLLGDEVKEALDELEKLLHGSNAALHLRLKASLLEHFDNSNHVKLSTSFEDSLKKDPTCCHSLARLVSMHRKGHYGAEKLLEMIALHLDATYADESTWKEFASCFLKLSQCEEDRLSTCVDTSEGAHQELYSKCLSKAPAIFTNGVSGKTWTFRCRWWLTRHFRHSILASEIAAGDLQLLSYKAASASHLYGREFEYVVKASACLEEANNMDLFSFLQMHMLNSVGFI